MILLMHTHLVGGNTFHLARCVIFGELVVCVFHVCVQSINGHVNIQSG